MTIYHFSNETFGKYFITVFDQIKKKYPSQKIILVISTIAYSRSEKLFKNKIKARLRQTLGEDIKMIYDRIQFCKNVNSESFTNSISDDDIGFISGFNQIFKLAIVTRFKHFLNIHPSLLPFYRGPVPSYWVLKNKEKYSGFTIHEIDSNIDKGIIVVQEKTRIDAIDTVNSLDRKIAEQSIPQCIKVIESLINNKPLEYSTIDARNIYENHIDYMTFPSN
jgi:methionyl-tRNA formyltransferase